MGTNDDEEERTDHGAESVTGVGDAEATTAATRPRSNEEGNKGEVDAAESESEKEHRREEHRPVGRERGPARAERGDQERAGQYGGARESSHREPADRHAKEGTHEVHAEHDTSGGKRKMESMRESDQ